MSKNKFDTVIWDLDGTLLNTLDDLRNAVNYSMTEFGYPERALDEIRRFVGNGVKKLMELSIPGGLDNPDYPAAFYAFSNYYAAHNKENTLPYEGVTETINELSRLGIKQAIVSNKIDEAVKILNADFFGVDVALGDKDGQRRKPWPDMVLTAMKLLGADEKNTIYVGDSEVDIKTAENSGLPCISVLWGFRTEEELKPYNPKYLVKTPREIISIVTDAE